jgi:hypothetical protein
MLIYDFDRCMLIYDFVLHIHHKCVSLYNLYVGWQFSWSWIEWLRLTCGELVISRFLKLLLSCPRAIFSPIRTCPLWHQFQICNTLHEFTLTYIHLWWFCCKINSDHNFICLRKPVWLSCATINCLYARLSAKTPRFLVVKVRLRPIAEQISYVVIHKMKLYA